MLHLFIGENSFEIWRELSRHIAEFSGEVEKKDGEDLTISEIQDLLQGQTLFSKTRLIILRDVSENKLVWDALSERVSTISDEVTLIIVEPKPDKRTKAYKAIMQAATVSEFPLWTKRDTPSVIQWVVSEAKSRNLGLTEKHARAIVERVGYDQWRLFYAIEKLSLVDDVSIEVIAEVIDASPDDNIFALLDTALRGDIKGVQASVEKLRLTVDAYQTFGLLSSQILQLIALSLTDKPSAMVAKDIGAHPFVLEKLTQYAARMNKREVKELLAVAGETDIMMKSSGLDPWLHVEQLLLSIAHPQ